MARTAQMQRLEPLIGEWSVESPLAPDVRGHLVLEWALDGAYVIERSGIPVPEAPDGLCVIAANADGDGYTQHYYDSRGVTRLYAMTFDGTTWTLLREKPDFSPLDFKQRYVGTLAGDRIDGAWEIDHGGGYELDFELNYVRAGS
jgi:hypothetical protein